MFLLRKKGQQAANQPRLLTSFIPEEGKTYEVGEVVLREGSVVRFKKLNEVIATHATACVIDVRNRTGAVMHLGGGIIVRDRTGTLRVTLQLGNGQVCHCSLGEGSGDTILATVQSIVSSTFPG